MDKKQLFQSSIQSQDLLSAQHLAPHGRDTHKWNNWIRFCNTKRNCMKSEDWTSKPDKCTNCFQYSIKDKTTFLRKKKKAGIHRILHTTRLNIAGTIKFDSSRALSLLLTNAFVLSNWNKMFLTGNCTSLHHPAENVGSKSLSIIYPLWSYYKTTEISNEINKQKLNMVV